AAGNALPGMDRKHLLVNRNDNATLLGGPLQDHGVRRVAQADVLDPHEVQAGLAPAQSRDDVAMNVLVSQQSEHGRRSPERDWPTRMAPVSSTRNSNGSACKVMVMVGPVLSAAELNRCRHFSRWLVAGRSRAANGSHDLAPAGTSQVCSHQADNSAASIRCT